ncbi:unnamed protein product [Prunus armeniaca]
MVEKGSHLDLLKDPEGAYSQLIHLQEVNKGSERTAEAQNKSEITREQSSQRMKLVRSLSQNSSVGSMRDNNTLQTEPEAPTLALEQPPKISLRCLAALNKHEIPVLLIGTVAAMTSGVMIPLFGVLMSRVVKTFYEPPLQQKTDTEFWAMMFMTLGLASLLVIPARRYFFSVAGSKLIERVRLMCFERVVQMEVAWFDEAENSSGAIGARLSSDTAILRGLVGDALAQMLAFIVLALIPLIGVNGYVQAKFMKGFSLWFVVANGGNVGLKSNLDWDVESEVTGDLGFRLMYEEASQVANDAIGSVRTIAAFCAEEKVMDLYRRKCEAPTEEAKRQGLISGIGFGISLFSLFCVYATSFYAGAKLVEAGKTTFSHVFQVFYALTMAALGISQWSSFAVDSSKAKNAAASIFAIIDRKSKIDPSDESGVKLDNVKGEIELRHVSFKYPFRPDIQIFQDLSLTIHCGNTVALVGESGSGKSTVVALFQLKWLRQQMGLVSEEPVLFNDTIRANIAYGKDGGATEAEIVAASELANAYTMPTASLGFDTTVGQRGVQLSGGQKQCIAIARAIIKSPKILLLDEATSALDAESERVVQDALDGVMVNRTTVVVAHRLSTIKNADVIAVVKNGVIVEIGKHDTLMNISDGFYASLVALHMSASTA